MTKNEMIRISVGDVVEYEENENLAVVTEVQESLQLAALVISKNEGNWGWQLALPGTVTRPVRLIGSISLATVADAFSRSMGGVISYEETLKIFLQEAEKGPKLVPGIIEEQPEKI